MKKTICLFLMLVCCACLLVACDPGTRSIDRVELDRVVSVELIRYDNPAQKEFISWIPDQFRELAPFAPSNATVLETLPADKIPDFLDAFSKTDILNKYYAYNSPKDICLRLSYENGDFLIIWANYKDGMYAGYIGEYSAAGDVLTFWGSFSSLEYYENLVDRFFETDLT